MRLKILLCSESIILDAQSGRVSCINLADDIVLPQFPAFLAQFAILSVFQKEDGDLDEVTGELSLAVNGQNIARGPLLIGFQGLESARSIVSLNGLVLPAPGILSVTLSSDETVLAEWTASISLADAQFEQLAELAAD